MKKRFDERDNPATRVAEDDYNAQQMRAARKTGVVMDGDEDFNALRQLVNSPKLAEDDDLQTLRELVNDHNRRRLHEALDRVLTTVKERRRTGDRAFLKNFGIRP